jgi:tRNA-modifying protein YgfZ
MSSRVSPITLPPAQLLELTGADAIAFAHAQFSSDVLTLPPGHWQFSSWLSAQGRVRFFFMLLHDMPARQGENRLRLVLRGGTAEAFRAELSRFVFRAKVSLRVVPEIHALGCDQSHALSFVGALPAGAMLAVRDDISALAMPGATPRWLLLHTSGTDQVPPTRSESALNDWRLEDIRAGLPELAPALADHLLPQWMGLDRLGAINVGKGCYPGQEIMARLHFKGGNKRGLCQLEMCCDALPPSGATIDLGSGRIDDPASANSGVILSAAWRAQGLAEALAVVADTAANEAMNSGAQATGEIKVISRFT